jgi:DNA ligase (NAD+)
VEDLALKGLSFCFTGELASMKRGEAEEKIRALGASAKSSVVKDLSFLVTNDPESGSGKNKKARDLGIAIIDETAFLAILANPGTAKSLAGSPAEKPEGKKKKKSAAQSELF